MSFSRYFLRKKGTACGRFGEVVSFSTLFGYEKDTEEQNLYGAGKIFAVMNGCW